MIYDVGVLYREAPTLIRVSDVAGAFSSRKGVHFLLQWYLLAYIVLRSRSCCFVILSRVGLYLEVFLGLLLHISKSSPLFPEKQFLYDVSTWVSSVLSENIFGACVVMGLLRYKLLRCVV